MDSRSINKVVLLGNVVSDAEVSHIPSLEKDVANFSIVTNESYKDKANGEWKDAQPEYHDCVVWGPLAIVAEKIARRGNLIHVFGKTKTKAWEDKEGNRRKKKEVLVSEMTLITDRQAERIYRGPGDAQAPPDDDKINTGSPY